MTPEEKIKKSEQRIRAEKQKIARQRKKLIKSEEMQKIIKNTLWGSGSKVSS